MRERFTLMGCSLQMQSLKPLTFIGLALSLKLIITGIDRKKASRVGVDGTKIFETWLSDNLGGGISYAWNNLRS
jgi:hypothetical protein